MGTFGYASEPGKQQRILEPPCIELHTTYVLAMVIARSPIDRPRHLSQQNTTENRRKLITFIALVIGSIALSKCTTVFAEQKNTSILQGQGWMDELLEGHPTRFYNAMGMHKPVFRRLIYELQMHARFHPTKFVSMEEQLGILLYACRTASTTRVLEERFQRSPDTISRCVRQCLTDRSLTL